MKSHRTLVILVLFAMGTPVLGRSQGNGIAATGTGGSHVIQGQIFLPSGRRAENVKVRLKSFGASDLSVMSSSNGDFTFPSLAPGTYSVIIEAGTDYETAEEQVFIDTDVSLGQTAVAASTSRPYRVIIHLQPKGRYEGGKPAVVSTNALIEAPEPARKLYEKGLEQAQAGDSKKSVESLKSAISLYPNFAAALDELGVQYLKLNQADKAIEPLQMAVKLNAEAFRPNLNLGIALLETKQFDAAENSLKSALKTNDSSPTAHMYLGIALIGTHKQDEARTELETAAKAAKVETAKAHYYLGGIYWGDREYNRAADELEMYLKLVPKAPEATKVRDTIKELRSKK